MEDMSMGWVGCILSTLFVGAVAYYSNEAAPQTDEAC